MKQDSMNRYNSKGPTDLSPITPQALKSSNQQVATPVNDHKRRRSKNIQNGQQDEKIQVKKLNIDNPSSVDYSESKPTLRKNFNGMMPIGEINYSNLDNRHGYSMQYLREKQEL